MSAGTFAMIIGMREKTRRAEVRVLEIGSKMVRLSVDGGRDQCLLAGDVLWVDVPGEPSPPAEAPAESDKPNRREAMTNYRPVARDEAIGSWSRGDNVTSQCGFDWGGADVSCEPTWFAYNHTRQEFTIGSWGQAEPEGGRWVAFSDEEVQILNTALLDAEQVYTELTDAAKAMIEEVMTEYARRTTSFDRYRGPGVYEGTVGWEYEVLGTLPDADGVLVVMRSASSRLVTSETLEEFDQPGRWRWVRALGEEG